MRLRRKLNNPELDRMTDACMAAMNTPEGEEILRQMTDKEIIVPEGIAQLLILSGEYERREDT